MHLTSSFVMTDSSFDCHRFLFSVSNENIHGKCSVASQYAAALANWKYNITLLAISGQLCGHFQIPCFLHIIILQFCRFSSLAERSNKNQTKKKKKLPKRIQSCVCFGECSFCVWSFLHFIVWCLVLELRIWVLPRRECFMHERWNSVCTTFSCSVRQRRFALWCNCWEKKKTKTARWTQKQWQNSIKTQKLKTIARNSFRWHRKGPKNWSATRCECSQCQ